MIAAGAIVSQDPVAGVLLTPGTAVNYTLSKGPQPTPSPTPPPHPVAHPAADASTDPAAHADARPHPAADAGAGERRQLPVQDRGGRRTTAIDADGFGRRHGHLRPERRHAHPVHVGRERPGPDAGHQEACVDADQPDAQGPDHVHLHPVAPLAPRDPAAQASGSPHSDQPRAGSAVWAVVGRGLALRGASAGLAGGSQLVDWNERSRLARLRRPTSAPSRPPPRRRERIGCRPWRGPAPSRAAPRCPAAPGASGSGRTGQGRRPCPGGSGGTPRRRWSIDRTASSGRSPAGGWRNAGNARAA